MDRSRSAYVSLCLDKKVKAIKRIENGEKMKDVALSFNIKANTLSTIYKNREKLKEKLIDTPTCKKFKRIRLGKHAELDEAVLNFVQQARQHNIPVNGSIIKKKAATLSERLNISNFNASDGWLQRLKKRSGMQWKCLTGDAAEADEEVAKDWIANIFVPLMARYDENDVFNADETGLFFKCLPGKTMAFKNDKCLNGKYSKERITIMLGSNMSGTEKLKPFVIGKSKNPRCFKTIKSLPVDYDSNKKAWMNSYLFEKWMRKLDKKFTQQNRKVLFFVDNCSAHDKNIKAKLQSIQLEFFPPNLTPILQPMDRGIIRTLKVHYRDAIVMKMIDQIENNLPIKKITLLDAINILSYVWDTKITSTIICNCFRKAGFIDSHFLEEDDLPISNFVNEIANYERLRTAMPDATKEAFEEFVNVDQDVMVGDIMTDDDIIERINGNSNSDDIENNNEGHGETLEQPRRKISYSEKKEAIETIRSALQQTEDVPHYIFQHLNDIQKYLSK